MTASLANGLAETMHMRRKKKRILMVEDNETYAEAACMMLEKLACDPLTVGNVADARIICEQMKFDLCLIDLGLPDGSGLDLAAYLQMKFPEMEIGIYTGGAVSDGTVREALNQGFTIMGKPLRPQNVRSFLIRPAMVT